MIPRIWGFVDPVPLFSRDRGIAGQRAGRPGSPPADLANPPPGGILKRPAELGGDRSRQLVIDELHRCEIRHVAELGRKGTGELIPAQIQLREAGEIPDPAGNGPGDLVVSQVQDLEIREVL